jgi:tetratricopeptide (TPR) repeat protein
MQHVPTLPRSPSFANAVAMGLSCALSAADPAPWRANALHVLEPLAEEALHVSGILADDASGLYELLVDARTTAHDDDGARRVAHRWLLFLEAEVARAGSAEGRAAFDSHVLAASLAVGEPQRAVRRLSESERDLPDDYNAPARLALALKQMGRLDEAQAAANRALRKVYGPRKGRVLETLAEVLVAKGDVRGGRAALQQALAWMEQLPPEQRSPKILSRLNSKLNALPESP